MGYLFVILCVTLNTIGDWTAKKDHELWSLTLWSMSAFCWLGVMRRLPVGWSSVFYSVITTIVAVAMGVLVLKEPLTPRLIVGGLLAVAAILVLR